GGGGAKNFPLAASARGPGSDGAKTGAGRIRSTTRIPPAICSFLPDVLLPPEDLLAAGLLLSGGAAAATASSPRRAHPSPPADPRAVWFAGTHPIRSDRLPQGHQGVQEEVSYLISPTTSLQEVQRITTTLWYLWKASNDHRFNKKQWKVSNVTHAVQADIQTTISLTHDFNTQTNATTQTTYPPTATTHTSSAFNQQTTHPRHEHNNTLPPSSAQDNFAGSAM
ncbi:unnamed protein product, partial [Urochloa humidicola]